VPALAEAIPPENAPVVDRMLEAGAILIGLPSACVPAARDVETGLPVGVLITGRRFREDLCLDAAEAIEARLPLSTPIDPVGTPSGHPANRS
jgi:Asp-tRNA(Asn)/Glu-tRNA(Gln) amidotransferase A subunit family amidase